jgi:hypothetical protein
MSDQYTITGPDGKPMVVTGDMLAGMNFRTLTNLRDINTDQTMQNLLAGYEHRAFAREYLKENPWMIPSMAVATPLYTGVKALPKAITGNQSRSQPSLFELGQGMMGVGEGAAGALSDVFAPVFRSSSR